MLVVGLLYHHQATGNLVDMVQRQNIMIDKMISTAIWMPREDYFRAAASGR